MLEKILAFLIMAALLLSAAAVSEGSGVTDFGIKWMRTESITDEENAVVSPVSGYLALAMAAMGAEGETRAEILNALNLTDEAFEAEVKALFCAVSSDAAAANSVWADAKFALKDEYVSAVRDALGADAFSVTLSSAETADAINRWVDERTMGKIPSLLTDPLSDDAALAIVSTLYFNKEWQDRFNVSNTREKVFHTDAGEDAFAEFMNKTAYFRYFASDDGAQAVILPYEGERSVFLAILPPEGVTADGYLKTLSADAVAGILENAESRKVALSLPKIEKEARLDMKASLEKMGISRAFDENAAELGKMVESDVRLYLSDAVQKVRLSLAERGTEAAAATALIANGTSAMMPEETVTVAFDRSFLYAILDAETGAAMFMGKVTNPALFDLSSQGVALGRTFSDGVPTLYIVTDEDWKEAGVGTYSIECGGLGVEQDSVHPLENADPVTVCVGKTGLVRFMFDDEPTRVTARFWKEGERKDENSKPLAITDSSFRVPAGENGTVEITAEWKGFTDFEGTVRYSFAYTAK